MTANKIKNVAIVGAGGNSGIYMTKALLANGQHTVTALTRADSKSALPSGVHVKKVDYSNQASLTEALQGQDALIITLGVMAPPDQQSKLLQAAADANVSWVLPNEWGADSTNEALVTDIPAFQKAGTRAEIAKLGKSSYIGVSTGFWYEWSLAIPDAFGFDLANRTATFFDDGETLTSMSTWPQVGRAVASLLSLPIEPEGEDDKDRCLARFRNKQVYVSSFTITQKDMFESVLRETKTSASDWTVIEEPSRERHVNGKKAMQGGDMKGFVRMMYARVFYPDNTGNFEKTKGTINGVLGLPKEDLDEATRAAIRRAKELNAASG